MTASYDADLGPRFVAVLVVVFFVAVYVAIYVLTPAEEPSRVFEACDRAPCLFSSTTTVGTQP